VDNEFSQLRSKAIPRHSIQWGLITSKKKEKWLITEGGKSEKKRTPWPLVRKRTIPTEQPPFVGEI
jgi:hypothetical protein